MLKNTVTSPHEDINTTGRIAIVVPVYNVEKYVAECLQSVLDQTYQNWECFLIDDGSTDSSNQIIDAFSEADRRFRTFHKPNEGVGKARNFALDIIENEKERFDFIYFVDSDDLIEPTLLAKLVETCKTDNSDIVVCGRYAFDTRSRHVKGTIYSKETINNEEFVALVFSCGKWGKTSCDGGYSFKLFRSEILSGIRYTHDRNIIEDELFCLQAAAKVTRISVLPEPLYGYRQRLSSLAHDTAFVTMHLKCRELCIPVAASISRRASLVAVSAYLQTALSLSKNKGKLTGINHNVVSQDMLNELFDSGLCPKKNVSLYRMFERHPTILKIYLNTRAVFHSLFKKKKRGNNLFT